MYKLVNNLINIKYLLIINLFNCLIVEKMYIELNLIEKWEVLFYLSIAIILLKKKNIIAHYNSTIF